MRILLICLLWTIAATAHAQITVRSGAGADAAGITAARDAFRADLGGGTTAGINGSFGGLRREINWDGVPASSAAPNPIAPNFFNVNSPRGLVVSTPGSGFQVSGAVGDIGAVRFGNFNASYPSIFQTFTAQRLFTSVGSNVFDVRFFVPGTNIAAEVAGFGLVFTDVDVAGASSLQFFDATNLSMGSFAAPALNGGLSFLGGSVALNQPRIARVRVTLGNTAIGPNDDNGSSDIVVSDDFIYGEPFVTSIFNNGFE